MHGAANGDIRVDGAYVDGGLPEVIERNKTQDAVVLAAAAETPWRAMLPLLDASRARLASTGIVLAVRGEPQRRTTPAGGASSAKVRLPPAMPPATGAAGPAGADDAIPLLLHIEVQKDGPMRVDGEALAGPLGARRVAGSAVSRA